MRLDLSFMLLFRRFRIFKDVVFSFSCAQKSNKKSPEIPASLNRNYYIHYSIVWKGWWDLTAIQLSQKFSPLAVSFVRISYYGITQKLEYLKSFKWEAEVPKEHR